MNSTLVRLMLVIGLAGCVGLAEFSTAAAQETTGDWNAPTRAARKKNPLPRDDALCIEVGKEIYSRQCATCHGDAGHGDGPSAAHLDIKPADLASRRVATQTDGAVFWKIGEGHRPMPSFKNMVSEDGRWHVVLYLRTLVPPASTQPATQPAK